LGVSFIISLKLVLSSLSAYNFDLKKKTRVTSQRFERIEENERLPIVNGIFVSSKNYSNRNDIIISTASPAVLMHKTYL